MKKYSTVILSRDTDEALQKEVNDTLLMKQGLKLIDIKYIFTMESTIEYTNNNNRSSYKHSNMFRAMIIFEHNVIKS